MCADVFQNAISVAKVAMLTATQTAIHSEDLVVGDVEEAEDQAREGADEVACR